MAIYINLSKFKLFHHLLQWAKLVVKYMVVSPHKKKSTWWLWPVIVRLEIIKTKVQSALITTCCTKVTESKRISKHGKQQYLYFFFIRTNNTFWHNGSMPIWPCVSRNMWKYKEVVKYISYFFFLRAFHLEN